MYFINYRTEVYDDGQWDRSELQMCWFIPNRIIFLSEIFAQNMTLWLLLKSPTWQQSNGRELQLLPYKGYVFTRSLLAPKLLSLTETSLIYVTCQAPLGI